MGDAVGHLYLGIFKPQTCPDDVDCYAKDGNISPLTGTFCLYTNTDLWIKMLSGIRMISKLVVLSSKPLGIWKKEMCYNCCCFKILILASTDTADLD